MSVVGTAGNAVLPGLGDTLDTIGGAIGDFFTSLDDIGKDNRSYWQITRDDFLQKSLTWYSFRAGADDLGRGQVPAWVVEHFRGLFPGHPIVSVKGNDTRYLGYPSDKAEGVTWWVCLLESGNGGSWFNAHFREKLRGQVPDDILAEQGTGTAGLAYHGPSRTIYFLPHPEIYPKQAFRRNPDTWATDVGDRYRLKTTVAGAVPTSLPPLLTPPSPGRTVAPPSFVARCRAGLMRLFNQGAYSGTDSFGAAGRTMTARQRSLVTNIIATKKTSDQLDAEEQAAAKKVIGGWS